MLWNHLSVYRQEAQAQGVCIHTLSLQYLNSAWAWSSCLSDSGPACEVSRFGPAPVDQPSCPSPAPSVWSPPALTPSCLPHPMSTAGPCIPLQPLSLLHRPLTLPHIPIPCVWSLCSQPSVGLCQCAEPVLASPTPAQVCTQGMSPVPPPKSLWRQVDCVALCSCRAWTSGTVPSGRLYLVSVYLEGKPGAPAEQTSAGDNLASCPSITGVAQLPGEPAGACNKKAGRRGFGDE